MKERIRAERYHCPKTQQWDLIVACRRLKWSKWWSQSWSVQGEGKPTEHKVQWVNQAQVYVGTPRCLPWQRSSTLLLCCNTADLLQYFGFCAVLWWKAPEMSLGVFNAFWLFMTPPELRELSLMSLHLSQFCSIRRDKYLQICIGMSQYLLQGGGGVAADAVLWERRMAWLKSNIPPCRICFLLTFSLTQLKTQLVATSSESSYENQGFQQHTPQNCPLRATNPAPTKHLLPPHRADWFESLTINVPASHNISFVLWVFCYWKFYCWNNW